MTSPQTHSVSFSVDNSLDADDLYVKLEQIKPPKISQYANIADVYKLWISVITGRSARSIRAMGCPVEFDGTAIKCYLGFYSWPCNPELLYSVTCNLGDIYSSQNVKKPREFSIFVDNVSRADFDYYMENVSIVWESPSFAPDGSIIPHPSATFHGNYVQFDCEVFGAIRVKGNAVGKYHVCEMILDREMAQEDIPTDEVTASAEYTEGDKTYHIISGVPRKRMGGYKIENIQNTITATWMDNDVVETEQMPLEIPQCIQDLLTMCGDMFSYVLLWCEEVSTRQVYYNTCKGEVIEIFDGNDPQVYCSRLDTNTDPGPWLHSLLNAHSGA